MKIFVHESITGGEAGSSRIASPLLAEGRMMLEALLADLIRVEEHQLVVLVDRSRLERIAP